MKVPELVGWIVGARVAGQGAAWVRLCGLSFLAGTAVAGAQGPVASVRWEPEVIANPISLAQTNLPHLGIKLFARPLPEPREEGFQARPAQDIFEAQLAMVRLGISPGPLDGLMGAQTQAGLRLFQERAGLPVTGEWDEATRQLLLVKEPPLTRYVLLAEDLVRMRTTRPTWLGKSQQDRLDYENAAELLGEWTLTHPKYVRYLNPEVDWSQPKPGTTIRLPHARYPEPRGHAAFIRISLGRRHLQVCDGQSNVVVHFPCSIGRFASQRPVGRLEVAVIVPDPNYTFDPKIFPESEEGRRLGRRLILPPGPNNPVGVAWIGLSLAGYGIHGTPIPEKVGRTESHGCFRLANWNAAYLIPLIWVSMPVYVEP